MIRVSSTAPWEDLDEALDRVIAGDRVVLQREGRDVAAVISLDDLRLLEKAIREAEDRVDLAEARKALADETTTSYDAARDELGLK